MELEQKRTCQGPERCFQRSLPRRRVKKSEGIKCKSWRGSLVSEVGSFLWTRRRRRGWASNWGKELGLQCSRGSWSVQGCLLKRRGEVGVLLVLFLRRGDLERVRMEPEQEEEPLVLFLRRGDRRRG